MPQEIKTPKVLAIASGGGHWVQLSRLWPAMDGCEVVAVTVNPAYRSGIRADRFYVVNDATRWNKFGVLKLIFRLFWILLKERPDVVISTGAAPGYIALRFGKLLGARTIWIDSIANVERLSMSGQKIGRLADLWLTQWSHLAKPEGPRFEGAVL